MIVGLGRVQCNSGQAFGKGMCMICYQGMLCGAQGPYNTEGSLLLLWLTPQAMHGALSVLRVVC